MTWLFGALALLMGGGVLAALLTGWPRLASAVGALSAIMACVVGAVFAARGLGGEVCSAVFPWHIPAGEMSLARDPLSAFFLVPVFGLGGLAAAYGYPYLLAYRDTKPLGVVWLAFNTLLAAMAVVLVARHAILFLVAWETMSLASYVLVVLEHERSEVQRAGWVYLIAAHLGTAFLVFMFLLLDQANGGLVLAPVQGTLEGWQRTLLLLLGLVGFGLKAGLVPLHVWLPEAHAAAPSHVSALMSGVLTKMGVYGIVRVAMLVGPAPLWWGPVLIVIGLSGAVYGVALASYQRDIKRVLAYSTIENIGLVMLGLGLGFWGQATGHTVLGVLGLFGGLMHIWNHTLMKGLLFLGAGTVVHATGSRDLERMGGLMRRDGVAGVLFLVGALAMAGLPPLNGFAGEWLLYRAMLEGVTMASPGAAVAFMLAVGVLSAVGTAAVLCFLRLFAMLYLGEPRSPEASSAHAARPAMLGPMALLSLACVFIGGCPGVVARVAAPVVSVVATVDHGGVSGVEASFGLLGKVWWVGWGLVGAVASLSAWLMRGRVRATDETWGCGYAAPTARMQYTGRSFAEILTELLPRALRLQLEVERPQALFPASGGFHSRSEDPITRGLYEPALRRAADRLVRLRWLQQGSLHMYLLYILVALMAGLVWTSCEGMLNG